MHAFVELIQDLLSVPGVEYVLSERLCQDPESFFGKQRAAGGRNENPTIQQFRDNTVTLRLQRSAALEPVRGNCRKRPGPVVHSALMKLPYQSDPENTRYNYFDKLHLTHTCMNIV